MLSAQIQKLAEKTGAMFDKTGTELVDVMRSVPADNDYGGVDDGVPASVYGEIPCVLYTKPKSGTNWILGQEYLDARIHMPAMYNGEVIEIKMTDKLRIAEREGANPERLYAVKDPLNIHGVYFDVGVVMES